MARQEYHAVQGAYVNRDDPPDPAMVALRDYTRALVAAQGQAEREPCLWCDRADGSHTVLCDRATQAEARLRELAPLPDDEPMD